MLIKYIRTPKHYVTKLVFYDGFPHAYVDEVGGEPIGVIVSTERGRVGWSLCNHKDRFDKTRGKLIAINRADHYGFDRESVMRECPDSIRQEIVKMYDRSEKYFK